MPRPFTPADREEVVEAFNDLDNVHDAVECGPGVGVVYKRSENHRRTYTRLVEDHGWYIDSYEPREAGDYAIAMPITEVPG